MTVIVGEGVLVNLVLQIGGCIACLLAQQGSSRSSWVPVPVDEQQNGNIELGATTLSWFPTACTSEGHMENSQERLERGKLSENRIKERRRVVK